MIKYLITFLLTISFSVKSPSIFKCSSYCVMDGNSLEVLEGSNINLKRSVASISKIMTAIIALESDHLFDIVKVSNIIKTIEGSAIYVEEGDEISFLDLVYGLLLRSGNDAAVLIAEHLNGSINEFVKMMNDKAKIIGMKNTTFNNPTGLDIFDEGNLSSSYDMCLLMSYCMDNEMFCKIAKTKYYKSQLKGQWKNKNKLLFSYDCNIIGKTGYTKKAKRTLITGLEKEKQRIVICTLNCGNDFEFHKNLYQHYYLSYWYIICLDKGDNYINDYYIYSDRIIGKRIKKDGRTHLIIYYYINDKGNVEIRIY